MTPPAIGTEFHHHTNPKFSFRVVWNSDQKVSVEFADGREARYSYGALVTLLSTGDWSKVEKERCDGP